MDLGAMETCEILDSLAWAWAERGGTREAALLLGAASAQRERLGLEPTERELVYVQAARAAVSATLPGADVADAIVEGSGLTDQALRALVDQALAGETASDAAVQMVPAGRERAPPDRLIRDQPAT